MLVIGDRRVNVWPSGPQRIMKVMLGMPILSYKRMVIIIDLDDDFLKKQNKHQIKI
jgi:hypothetical protein